MKNQSKTDEYLFELENALRTIEEFEKCMPVGFLEVKRNKNSYRFRANRYDKKNNKIEKRYISTFEAEKFAQKRYFKKLKPVIKKEIASKKNGMEYDSTRKYAIYNDLPVEIKHLITPLFFDASAKVQKWIDEGITPSSYKNENLVFPTNRGEKVRSTDEQLIANTLYKFNDRIIYKYENKLVLPIDNKIVYPDFEIISINSGNVYYLEHFGMIDNDEYFRKSFLEKIQRYIRNGIYPR